MVGGSQHDASTSFHASVWLRLLFDPRNEATCSSEHRLPAEVSKVIRLNRFEKPKRHETNSEWAKRVH
jgi:hypothetical protein